ncbi:MAG: PLDc N-terminal domain-containing protein, partial [Muribaculaceae bacterium]|nr:PLDc N-terminal domain-containing protein [Muribaculaceae bacterium]
MLCMTIFDSLIALGFMLAYFAIIISCVVVVLSENRNPIRSMAWTIALLFLPVVGLIFYLFFGRSLKGQHLMSRHNKRKLLHNVRLSKVELEDTNLSASERQLVKLAYTLTKYPLTMNNRLKIFTDGASKFAAFIHDLESARSSIYVQYYIFSDDKIGTRISDILISKAREGVTVRVIYDNVGSLGTSRRFFRNLQENGVEVHPFFRVTFPQLANRINWRNHRKIAI